MKRNYYAMRYGEAYEHGLFGPVQMTATFEASNSEPLERKGELYCGPDGDVFIDIHLADDDVLKARNLVGKELDIVGSLADGGTLERGKWSVFMHSVENQAGVVKSILRARGKGRHRITYRKVDLQSPYCVTCSLLNCIFLDTEVTRETSGRARLDTLPVSYAGGDYLCRMKPEFFDEEGLKLRLKHGVLRILPTATVETTVSNGALIDDVIHEMHVLAYLFSFASGTKVAVGDVIVRQDGESCERRFLNATNAAYNEEAASWAVLNPRNHPKDFASFLDGCGAKANDLWKPYKLWVFIDYLCMAAAARHMEARIAFVILALEFLTAMDLRNQDQMTDDQLANMNLSQKLSRANRRWRFVEKRYFEDWLRRDVRNPLMHTGLMPLLNSGKELLAVFRDLYVLAALALFKIVGYNGNWVDCRDDWNSASVPWAHAAP